MPGHRLPRSTRLKLKAGMKVSASRGWTRDELPPAGPCYRLDPATGERCGVVIRPEAAQLKITGKQPWCFQREVGP